MDTLVRKFFHWLKPHLNNENAVLGVAALISISLVWNTMAALQRNFQLQQQVDELKQEIEILKLEADNLAFQQKYFKSDEFLELSSRERLNKALPGEKVIILPHVEETQDDFASTPHRIKRSNFELWMYFFFGDSDKS